MAQVAGDNTPDVACKQPLKEDNDNTSYRGEKEDISEAGGERVQEKAFLVSCSQNLKVGSSCQSILHKWVSSVSMEAVLLYNERSVAVQMNKNTPAEL